MPLIPERTKLKFSLFRRIVCSLLLLVFAFNSTLYGATPVIPVQGQEIRYPLSGKPLIQIPSRFGSIESFKIYSKLPSEKLPLIVHIQDAHGNPLAQRNMSRIIRFLSECYGINTVLSEGAAEKLDTGYLEFLRDKKANRRLLDRLTESGEISGVELALDPGSNHETLSAFGLEDASLYRENFELFRSVMSQNLKIRKYLEDLRKELDRRSSRVLKGDCLSLIRVFLGMNGRENSLVKDLDLIILLSRRVLGINLAQAGNQKEYPNLVRLARLKKDAGKIDFEKAKRDWETIKSRMMNDELQKKLKTTAALIDSLFDAGSSHFEGNFRLVLEKLHEGLKPQEFKFSSYPYFTQFARMKIFEQEIAASEAFSEMELLFEKLFQKLAVSADEREMIREAVRFRFLSRLLSLELTRGELEESIKFGFSAESYPSGIPVREARKFYSKAIAREEIFIQKIQEFLSQSKNKRLIVVTGGFHTDRLKQYFSDQKISHCILRPQMDSSGRENYLRSMTRTANFTPERSELVLAQLAQSEPTLRTMLGESVYQERKSNVLGEAASLGRREKKRLKKEREKAERTKREKSRDETAQAAAGETPVAEPPQQAPPSQENTSSPRASLNLSRRHLIGITAGFAGLLVAGDILANTVFDPRPDVYAYFGAHSKKEHFDDAASFFKERAKSENPGFPKNLLLWPRKVAFHIDLLMSFQDIRWAAQKKGRRKFQSLSDRAILKHFRGDLPEYYDLIVRDERSKRYDESFIKDYLTKGDNVVRKDLYAFLINQNFEIHAELHDFDTLISALEYDLALQEAYFAFASNQPELFWQEMEKASVKYADLTIARDRQVGDFIRLKNDEGKTTFLFRGDNHSENLDLLVGPSLKVESHRIRDWSSAHMNLVNKRKKSVPFSRDDLLMAFLEGLIFPHAGFSELKPEEGRRIESSVVARMSSVAGMSSFNRLMKEFSDRFGKVFNRERRLEDELDKILIEGIEGRADLQAKALRIGEQLGGARRDTAFARSRVAEVMLQLKFLSVEEYAALQRARVSGRSLGASAKDEKDEASESSGRGVFNGIRRIARGASEFLVSISGRLTFLKEITPGKAVPVLAKMKQDLIHKTGIQDPEIEVTALDGSKKQVPISLILEESYRTSRMSNYRFFLSRGGKLLIRENDIKSSWEREEGAILRMARHEINKWVHNFLSLLELVLRMEEKKDMPEEKALLIDYLRSQVNEALRKAREFNAWFNSKRVTISEFLEKTRQYVEGMEILKRKAEQLNSEDARQAVEEWKRLNDFLNLMTSSEGGQLSDLIDLILIIYKKDLENVTVHKNLPAEEVRIKMPGFAFVAILGNMIRNAVINRANSISFEAKLNGDSGKITFGIRNNGNVIPPEHLKKITAEKFSTRKIGRLAEGGIGLLITKRILELEGGNIRVSSSAQDGTLFEMEIPLVQASSLGDGKLIALGGNALIAEKGPRKDDRTDEAQKANMKEMLKGIIKIYRPGVPLVITHGNGPQVGDLVMELKRGRKNIPRLNNLVAKTQEEIFNKYILPAYQELRKESGLDLPDLVLNKTRVMVDPFDPAFNEPVKPVGPYFSTEEAQHLAGSEQWVMHYFDVIDRETGKKRSRWRRVVASPAPNAIYKPDLVKIREALSAGKIVVAVGGGGIPGYERGGMFLELEGVVDKDRSSALLAKELGLDDLLIVTGVPRVAANFGKPNEFDLIRPTPAEMRKLLAGKQFPEGSMGPKVQAILAHVENGGERGIITDIDHIAAVYDEGSNAGTVVVKGGSLGQSHDDYVIEVDGKRIYLLDAMFDGSFRAAHLIKFVPTLLERIAVPGQKRFISREEAFRLIEKYRDKTQLAFKYFDELVENGLIKKNPEGNIYSLDFERFLNAKGIVEASRLLNVSQENLKKAVRKYPGVKRLGRKLFIPLEWIEEQRIRQYQLISVDAFLKELRARGYGISEASLVRYLKNPKKVFGMEIWTDTFGQRKTLLEPTLADSFHHGRQNAYRIDLLTAMYFIEFIRKIKEKIDEWFSVDSLAREIGVSRKTILGYIEKGVIKAELMTLFSGETTQYRIPPEEGAKLKKIFAGALEKYRSQISPYVSAEIKTWGDLMDVMSEWETSVSLAHRWAVSGPTTVEELIKRKQIWGIYIKWPYHADGTTYFPPQEVKGFEEKNNRKFKEIANFVAKHTGETPRGIAELEQMMANWPSIDAMASRLQVTGTWVRSEIKAGRIKAKSWNVFGKGMDGYIIPVQEMERLLAEKQKKIDAAAEFVARYTGIKPNDEAEFEKLTQNWMSVESLAMQAGKSKDWVILEIRKRKLKALKLYITGFKKKGFLIPPQEVERLFSRLRAKETISVGASLGADDRFNQVFSQWLNENRSPESVIQVSFKVTNKIFAPDDVSQLGDLLDILLGAGTVFADINSSQPVAPQVTVEELARFAARKSLPFALPEQPVAVVVTEASLNGGEEKIQALAGSLRDGDSVVAIDNPATAESIAPFLRESLRGKKVIVKSIMTESPLASELELKLRSSATRFSIESIADTTPIPETEREMIHFAIDQNVLAQHQVNSEIVFSYLRLISQVKDPLTRKLLLENSGIRQEGRLWIVGEGLVQVFESIRQDFDRQQSVSRAA